MSTVDTQVRLILETQCADIGRWVASLIRDAGFFIFFLADLGDAGNLAYISNADHAAAREAVEAWLSVGILAVTPEQADGFRRVLRLIAGDLRAKCPAGTGYALLLWVGGAMALPIAYVSSADRDDVRAIAREWLEKSPTGGEA